MSDDARPPAGWHSVIRKKSDMSILERILESFRRTTTAEEVITAKFASIGFGPDERADYADMAFMLACYGVTPEQGVEWGKNYSRYGSPAELTWGKHKEEPNDDDITGAKFYPGNGWVLDADGYRPDQGI